MALVSNVLDFNKTQIAAQQGTQQAEYWGSFSSTLNRAVFDAPVLTAVVLGPDRKTAPFIGMELNPENNAGVFSGSYKIASKTNTDASGTYSYLSWGSWATAPVAPFKTFTQTNGNVDILADGYWVMGQVSSNIPKIVSADALISNLRSSRGIQSLRCNFLAFYILLMIKIIVLLLPFPRRFSRH